MPPCHGEVAPVVVDLTPAFPPRPSWQCAFRQNMDTATARAAFRVAVDMADDLLRPGFDCASFWVSALIQINAHVTCTELKANTVRPASFESFDCLVVTPPCAWVSTRRRHAAAGIDWQFGGLAVSFHHLPIDPPLMLFQLARNRVEIETAEIWRKWC